LFCEEERCDHRLPVLVSVPVLALLLEDADTVDDGLDFGRFLAFRFLSPSSIFSNMSALSVGGGPATEEEIKGRLRGFFIMVAVAVECVEELKVDQWNVCCVFIVVTSELFVLFMLRGARESVSRLANKCESHVKLSTSFYGSYSRLTINPVMSHNLARTFWRQQLRSFHVSEDDGQIRTGTNSLELGDDEVATSSLIYRH
jgi:hypothetical protein